jgi:hypothetical protein
MARNRTTLNLLIPFPDANKLRVGATMNVKDVPCVVKKIGIRNINGFARVTFAKQKAK